MSITDQQGTEPLYEQLMLDPQCSADAFPFRSMNVQGFDQSLLFVEHNSNRMINSFVCIGDHSNVLQDVDGKIEGAEVRTENLYQRVKWTDDMVKLLITVLSYFEEYDAGVAHPEFRNRRFSSPKIGKWRIISNVMIQKDYNVSPQQCEDKFNDLNKKYRRLNELLGTGIACLVVENPTLIGLLHMSSGEVAEVMKLLRCKHLFYQQLCSYHNRNRLSLPHDESVQNLVNLALRGKGIGNCPQQVPDEISRKRMKNAVDHEVAVPQNSLDCNGSDYLPSECANGIPDKHMKSRLLDLEEQSLQLQQQSLELKWIEIQENLELEKMRLKNKILKLENQRLALKIRKQEMSMSSLKWPEGAQRAE